MVMANDMKFTDLKKAVKELNDSGLIDEKVKMVGVKKDVLVENFLDAVDGIPEEKDEEIPDLVVDVYNSLVGDEDASESELPDDYDSSDDSDDTALQELEQKKAEKKSERREKAEKKKEGGSLGWRPGTSAWHIYELLKKSKEGLAVEKGVALFREVMEKEKVKSSNPEARVATVLRAAVTRGLARKEGNVYIAN